MDQDQKQQVFGEPDDDAADAPPTMRITTISFRRTVQTKPYESASFEATADVPEGVSAHAAGRQLIAYVETQLGLRKTPTATADTLNDDLPF